MKCRNFIYSPDDTAAQQATQAYAREASFLRSITIPAIPRLSNNHEDGSGTGWKVMLSAVMRVLCQPTMRCLARVLRGRAYHVVGQIFFPFQQVLGLVATALLANRD